MDLINKQVSHPVFGTGKVTHQKNDILTISFPKQGSKCFIYPDAFERHLKINIAELEVVINEDINRKRAENEAEKERVRQEAQENLLRIEAEKASLALQKKKSTSKKKTTKVKSAVSVDAEESIT